MTLVAGNSIYSEGVKAIVNALRGNTALVKLELCILAYD